MLLVDLSAFVLGLVLVYLSDDYLVFYLVELMLVIGLMVMMLVMVLVTSLESVLELVMLVKEMGFWMEFALATTL